MNWTPRSTPKPFRLVALAILALTACGKTENNGREEVVPAGVEEIAEVQQDLEAWVEQKKVATDGHAYDHYGRSVGVSGNRIAIGADLADVLTVDNGAVYVVVRAAVGFEQEAKIVAFDGATKDQFGASVAISGDTLVAGAPGADAPELNSGAAYVYVRTNGLWTLQQKLTATSGGAQDAFGTSVALDGNTLVVGAQTHDGGVADAGAAYVFVRNNGAWTVQQKLVASDRAASDYFGAAVAVSGQTVLVGAPHADPKGPSSGASYAFVRTGTTWSQQQKLVPSGTAAGDRLGCAVALSGERALIGAELDDDLGKDSGAAFVFARNGTVWSLDQKLLATDGAPGDRLGGSVAIGQDRAIVGAAFDDDKGSNSGGAYTFERKASGWTAGPKVVPSDGYSNDNFGFAVGATRSLAVIGAWLDDDKGVNSGSVYATALASSLGDPCVSESDCASANCVDGVCCDSGCGGNDPTDCQACSVSSGGSADGTCTPVGAGSVCRWAAGECDQTETCDGSSLGCPEDTFLNGDTWCRGANGPCDVDDFCTGSSPSCPDYFVSSGTVCGWNTTGECDALDVCDGSNPWCPDTVYGPETTCRSAWGECDGDEVCDGTNHYCPPDVPATAGTICRAAWGECDAAEQCDGSSFWCPWDQPAQAGTQCRGKASDCDAEETCDGWSYWCPWDQPASWGTPCRAAAGECDQEETCDGWGYWCPPDNLVSAGVTCRTAAGDCDMAETCTGADATCPPDTLLVAGTACRNAAGACDETEMCTGSDPNCPPDVKKSAGTTCRDQNGDCDVAETCDGNSPACPANGFATSGTSCRVASGICDVAESCTGSAATCPPDNVPASCGAPPTCNPAIAVANIHPSLALSIQDLPTQTLKDDFKTRFSLERVLTQLLTIAGASGQDAANLYKRLWESQANISNAMFTEPFQPHCTDDGGTINGFPTVCPPETLLRPTAPSFFFPVAVFNRLDLAPLDGSHCGEYRIVFSRDQGPDPDAPGSFGEGNVIFEGQLPNPSPQCGVDACRPIAEYWNQLSLGNPATLLQALDKFYFTGLSGFRPVVHPANYGMQSDCHNGGQVRTDMFTAGHEWQLREFKLDIDCSGPCTVYFRPVTVKNTPTSQVHFQVGTPFADAYLSQVDELAAPTLMGISMDLPDQFNLGRSRHMSELAPDFLPATWQPISFQAPPQQIATQTRLTQIGSSLTPENIIWRELTQTCAGCHRFTNNTSLIGGGLVWPASLGFTHVDNQGTFSPALNGTFLPHRRNVLEAYLRACTAGGGQGAPPPPPPPPPANSGGNAGDGGDDGDGGNGGGQDPIPTPPPPNANSLSWPPSGKTLGGSTTH